MIQAKWMGVLCAVAVSFILAIAAVFNSTVSFDRVPLLLFANFISLGVIAYLYGVYSQ